ncbi:UNVERIFIED_CONTAM: Mitochondrial uncoupling protein 5 [Sesamum calycinum]|uniref:Mitochondrial uncoupling protein 5 n=1 Tax=Sesamum calycinum TaxID=2727403 RepID=A0AAW2QKW1_9LAMI
MGLKGFVEGGVASIVAGCSTHPLDLIKVRMQLQGEPAVQSLRPALAFHTAASHHVHLLLPRRTRLLGYGSSSRMAPLLSSLAFPLPSSARPSTPPPEWVSTTSSRRNGRIPIQITCR